MTDDLWNDELAADGPAPATPSKAPVAKVAAAGQAGALGTVLVYLAGLLGLELPAEVAAAAVGLLMFAAGYLKRG